MVVSTQENKSREVGKMKTKYWLEIDYMASDPEARTYQHVGCESIKQAKAEGVKACNMPHVYMVSIYPALKRLNMVRSHTFRGDKWISGKLLKRYENFSILRAENINQIN